MNIPLLCFFVSLLLLCPVVAYIKHHKATKLDREYAAMRRHKDALAAEIDRQSEELLAAMRRELMQREVDDYKRGNK